MLVVLLASQLEVVKLVGSTVSEWDPMVDLQAFGSAADHAGLVALVDEASEPAPVPVAPDLSSLLPGPLPVPFPFALGASAGRVEDVVAAGTDVAERAQGVSSG
jgi:hypothetical protein